MNATQAWLQLLGHIINDGEEVSPRGQLTRELPQQTIVVNLETPVMTLLERKLNYKFMAAEAHWILTGDDRVETIAPWNKRITDFSDDGVRFFGAYGPKVVDQLPYVLSTLLSDRQTRRAGLTIWREKPPATKDYPCTVAMFFGIRDGLLNNHVFMRSNDAWLGTPYDVFNFSMVAHDVCARFNASCHLHDQTPIRPGSLYLTAASSHLYETNWQAAREILGHGHVTVPRQGRAPAFWSQPPQVLLDTLRYLRDSMPGSPLRWWEADHDSED